MKIIAHRGFSEGYPENTLLAFEKALESGADGIETDLRLSLDQEVILFHDASLKALTGLDKAPEALTLAELKELDAGRGERIPSLSELLRLIDARATLILEIKYKPSTYKKLCELVAREIHDRLKWVEVSCFEDSVLEYMHHLDPRIRLHKLIDRASLLQDKNLERRYDYASYLDIDIKLRKRVSELGLIRSRKVIFWTVGKEDLSPEKEEGLYGIMTNNPLYLSQEAL